MKTIKIQEIKDSILEESKFDLVVETNGRIHTGALLFKMEKWNSLGEIKCQIELPEDVSEEDFIEAIINFYTENYDGTIYDSTAGTIRHWFSMNGVAAPAYKFNPEDYSRVFKVENRRFRYNRKSAMLEQIDEDNDVITAIGLSRESASEGLRYWCEMWNTELDEFIANELKEFQQ